MIKTSIKDLIEDIKFEKTRGAKIQVYFRPCDHELFAVAEDKALMRDRGATSIYTASSRVAARDIAEAAMQRAKEIDEEW